jgi:hypothetical protein
MSSETLPAENSTAARFRPLLIGGGRLALHLREYLSLLEVPHEIHLDSRNPEVHGNPSHLWLLVSDEALPALSRALKERHPGIPQLHSSAATVLPGVATLHPLMSFGPELYPLDLYRRIPFTLIHEEVRDFPGFENTIRTVFPNPVTLLHQNERLRYHINCTMISNLPVLLWDAALKTGPGLDPALFGPILEQTLRNFLKWRGAALTGPLVRGDRATLNQHREALRGSPESGLYEAFLEYYDHRT